MKGVWMRRFASITHDEVVARLYREIDTQIRAMNTLLKWY